MWPSTQLLLKRSPPESISESPIQSLHLLPLPRPQSRPAHPAVSPRVEIQQAVVDFAGTYSCDREYVSLQNVSHNERISRPRFFYFILLLRPRCGRRLCFLESDAQYANSANLARELSLGLELTTSLSRVVVALGATRSFAAGTRPIGLAR